MVKTNKGPGTGSPGTKPASGARPASGTKPASGARPASSSGGDNRRRRRFRPKVKVTAKKQSMLNMHKINSFKYDMNEVLSNSAMDQDKASSFLATVIAKASRNSTKEAKAHVKTFLEEGDLAKEEHDKIIRLLDKYSRYR